MINRFGSMISVHFCNEPVIDFETAGRADQARFSAFFHHMLRAGIYLPPSAFESWFLNNALSVADIDATIKAVDSFD
jgi:glutamate-1-semialdehyde 2,1-aminomutase